MSQYTDRIQNQAAEIENEIPNLPPDLPGSMAIANSVNSEVSWTCRSREYVTSQRSSPRRRSLRSGKTRIGGNRGFSFFERDTDDVWLAKAGSISRRGAVEPHAGASTVIAAIRAATQRAPRTSRRAVDRSTPAMWSVATAPDLAGRFRSDAGQNRNCSSSGWLRRSG